MLQYNSDFDLLIAASEYNKLVWETYFAYPTNCLRMLENVWECWGMFGKCWGMFWEMLENIWEMLENVQMTPKDISCVDVVDCFKCTVHLEE